VQLLDFDHDGHEEIWIHSGRGSVVIAPARGGAVEEYTLFQALTNYADVLTRRPEAYHEPRDPHGHGGGGQESGSPAYDADDRALFVDRILPADLAADAYAAGRYTPAVSWARTAMRLRIEAATASEVVVVLEAPEGSPPLEKRIRVGADGSLAVAWRWDPASAPAGAWFAPELSLAAPLDLALDPAADAWRFPVETTAKSERGLERTLQGESVTPRWPLAAGAARLELGVRTL